MKVLITGAAGDIADAVCRIVRLQWPSASVHGSELVDDAWMLANGFDRVHRVPRADSTEYVDTVLALQHRERFDAIIPVTDAEVWAFAHAAGHGLPIVGAPPAWAVKCLDKQVTAAWIASLGLPSLRTVPLGEATAEILPCMVKPRRGHGSRGLEIVHTEAQLREVQANRTDDAIAQELAGTAADEFTCGLFRHRPSGAVRVIALRRSLQGGLTARALEEPDPRIDAFLRELASRGDLSGSVNVQLRLTEQGPMVFEINARFSSTVMMRHLLGFTDLVWSLNAMLTGAAPGEYRAIAGRRVFRLSRELVVEPTA
jgi:carbamoyl-phosphate synthase large subunit